MRRLLGITAEGMSDGQVEAARDQMYDLARCVLEAHTVRPRNEQGAIALLSAADRDTVEERAAILEFDAGLTRAEATRQALTSFAQAARFHRRPKPS